MQGDRKINALLLACVVTPCLGPQKKGRHASTGGVVNTPSYLRAALQLLNLVKLPPFTKYFLDLESIPDETFLGTNFWGRGGGGYCLSANFANRLLATPSCV